MNSIRAVQAYVNAVLDQMTDPEERRVACVHCYSVAQNCAMLALKRGLNADLATAMGLLHDIYCCKTGVMNALHGPNGAEMVRVAFRYELAGIFTDEEQTVIKAALYHHSDKTHVHDAYDELLKDCDLLQHFLFDVSAYRYKSDRLPRVMLELGLGQPEWTGWTMPGSATSPYCPSRLADIAEELARKAIVGERTDADFMRIIRYFPEASAFGELTSAWCAAFVYHCCLEAGLELPIRTIHTAGKVAPCRLACVAAWYEWGTEHGFCHTESEGFVPERGDIVIYDNIIPPEDKPAGGPWYDHIGIVVCRDGGNLAVAEGNIGNKNVSGIVPRKRGENIGCYLRIPEGFADDGWKTDFKSGVTRITPVPPACVPCGYSVSCSP